MFRRMCLLHHLRTPGRKIVPYVYKTVPFEQINEALGLLRDGKTKGRVVLLFPED